MTHGVDIATPLTMVLAETTPVDDGVNPVTEPTIYYLYGLDLIDQSDGSSTEYFLYDGLGSVCQLNNGAEDLSPILFLPAFRYKIHFVPLAPRYETPILS